MKQNITSFNSGFGVYTARVMLGIDPEDYNLDFPKSNSNIPAAQKVGLYPNPASNYLVFEYTEPLPVQGILRLYTTSGKEVHSQPVDADITQFGVSLSGLTPGIYFYSYVSPNFTSNGRFVKK